MKRIWLLTCLLGASALGISKEVGSPALRTYRPLEYHAQNQNWAVVQDLRGVIYVANNDGVLEYDGVRWRMIRTHNVVRSLAMDASGRIYVGTVGDLGYLAPDRQGRMAFVSLLNRLEGRTSFADVWRIHPTSRGVYFFARDCVFLLTSEGFRSWQMELPLHNGFGVGDRFFVQQLGVGLLELDGQSLAPLPCGEFFKDDKIYFMLPWDAGRILVGTRTRGLFLYDGAKVAPLKSEADGFLKDNLLSDGMRFADGTLALATLQGGTVLLDRQGRIQLHLDQRSGLLSNSVYALCADRQGGLWMALGQGLARLQWPAAYSRFDAADGLEGTVLTVHRQGKTLYAGTSQGIYRLEDATEGRRPRFRPVSGIKAQTWNLMPVGDTILAANYSGLYELRNGQGRLLFKASGSAYTLHPQGSDGHRLYLGLATGLASLRRSGPASPWINEGLVPGIPDQVRNIADAGEGRLWLGTSSHQVLRVGFPGGVPRVERYGAAQGLESTGTISAVKVGHEVVFTGDHGVFHFDEGSRRFQPDPRFRAYFDQGPRRVKQVVEDARGRVWMETVEEGSNLHEVALGTRGPDGVYQWDKAPFVRFGNVELSTILPEPDGIVWFGSAEGLFRYDPSVPVNLSPAFSAHVRSLASRSGDLLFGGTQDKAAELTLSPRQNALRFEFSSTSFDSDWANLYQIRLDGYDQEWSAWSPVPFKEYSLLPDGHYVFRVRARNGGGAISGEDQLAFLIQPPWQRTWWARTLFLGAGLGAILAGHAARTRLLRVRNANLARRVAEATRELRLREHRLANQAADLEQMNEQLRLASEQKNQFLGIVAHDLRNPLNGILLASQLLEERNPGNGVARTAQMIQTECRDMDTLLGRFLDIAAIEAGTVTGEPVLCALTDLAEQITERHAGRAAHKGIQLLLEITERIQPVFVDPHFAKEVLDNLISNAVKFSPAGTCITVRLANDQDRVHLTVSDQGPGLSAQDQTRLFNRFTRLSATPTGGERSLGLGLSIAKHMVDAMGGRIWVVSTQGEGATFHVEFPTAMA